LIDIDIKIASDTVLERGLTRVRSSGQITKKSRCALSQHRIARRSFSESLAKFRRAIIRRTVRIIGALVAGIIDLGAGVVDAGVLACSIDIGLAVGDGVAVIAEGVGHAGRVDAEHA